MIEATIAFQIEVFKLGLEESRAMFAEGDIRGGLEMFAGIQEESSRLCWELMHK